MINEIKIDHTKPVFAIASNRGGGKYERIYLFTFDNKHFCSKHISDKDNGSNTCAWDNIEFKKEKKRIPLDAKTCPRRPVLTHPAWHEGEELYPSIIEKGLSVSGLIYTWEGLMNGGYKINGLPASREVEE